MPWLINAAQLDKFRKNPKNVCIFDASWHLPSTQRNTKEEFEHSHIASARFFDLQAFWDTNTHLPNMLNRDEETLSTLMANLGITPECKIILYDKSDLHSSCRAAWILKVLGHPSHLIHILDGGFSAWEKYGGKIENGAQRASSVKEYPIIFKADNLRTLLQIKENLHHPHEQIVDVRHPVRYAGGKEDRPNMRAGHIPGAYCFPMSTLFETDGKFKSLEKIRTQLTGIGVDFDSPIISMCGSGMTAAVLDFVLDLLDHQHHALYDGSWTEWGSDQLYPGEASLAERPVITSLDN